MLLTGMSTTSMFALQADAMIAVVTRAARIVDDHGNVHAPGGLGELSGRFVSKAGGVKAPDPKDFFGGLNLSSPDADWVEAERFRTTHFPIATVAEHPNQIRVGQIVPTQHGRRSGWVWAEVVGQEPGLYHLEEPGGQRYVEADGNVRGLLDTYLKERAWREAGGSQAGWNLQTSTAHAVEAHDRFAAIAASVFPRRPARAAPDEYLPGYWQIEHPERTAARIMEALAADLPPGVDGERLGKIREYATRAAQRPGVVQLVNGPHVIRFDADTVGYDDARRLADLVDGLHRSHPAQGPIDVNAIGFSQSAMAATSLGTAHIVIQPHVFTREWDDLPDGAAPFMPSAADHSVLEYVTAHEWGHAIDQLSDLESLALLESAGHDGLSPRAMDEPRGRETLAEMYAEWRLSDGRTGNPAAIHYARELGW